MDFMSLNLEPAYSESSENHSYISLDGEEKKDTVLPHESEEPFFEDTKQITDTIPEKSGEIIEQKPADSDIKVIRVPEEETLIEGMPYSREFVGRPKKMKQVEPPMVGTETVAKLLGTTAQTIREYTDNFDDYLKIKRRESGARRFTEKDIDNIRDIMKLKEEKGFTIKEMQAYLANPENPMIPSYTREVKDIRSILENMQKVMIMQMESSQKMLEDKESESAKMLDALTKKIEKQDETIEKMLGIIKESRDEEQSKQIENLMKMIQEKEEQIELMKKEAADKDSKIQELQSKPKKFFGLFR